MFGDRIILFIIEINCGDPGNITHGFKKGSGYMFGDRVSFWCEDGYQMTGMDEILCTDCGLWKPNKPVCSSK